MKKIITIVIILCITAYSFQGELFYFFAKIPIIEGMQFIGVKYPFDEEGILYKVVPILTKQPENMDPSTYNVQCIVANNIKIEIPIDYREQKVLIPHMIYAKNDIASILIDLEPSQIQAVNQVQPNLTDSTYRTRFVQKLERTYNAWNQQTDSEKVISMYSTTPSSINRSIPPDERLLNLNLLGLKAVTLPLGSENSFQIYKSDDKTILLAGPRILNDIIHSYRVIYFNTQNNDVCVDIRIQFYDDIAWAKAEELVHEVVQTIRCSKIET